MPRYDGETVLVTGYPELQARALVTHLLEAEPTTRLCLVVLDRLLDKARAALEQLEPAARERVELYEGDAAAMDLGLSGGEIRDLATRIDRIHHVAHVSYVGAERQLASYVNVQGAVEIVEIARTCEKLRILVHHSTAHVSGDRSGVVYEDDLDVGQGFHNVVQETRMRAEQVMRRAMAEVPIVVLRPTMMVGDSTTGEADRFDGPYLLVMLLLGLPGDMAVPLPSDSHNAFDVVPVDYVVKVARHVGLHPRARGQTLHLTSGEELTAAKVFDLIARAGGRRTVKSPISSQVARAVLSTPGIERLLRQPRELVQHLVASARYDTRHARRLLDESGLSCPPLAGYVDTWVRAVQEHVRGRREPGAAQTDVP